MAAETMSIGIRELRQGLSDYLRRASQGTSIIVTSRNKVIAQIGPPPPAATLPRRGLGAMKGKIRIADDFDRWPDDIQAGFEAEL